MTLIKIVGFALATALTFSHGIGEARAATAVEFDKSATVALNTLYKRSPAAKALPAVRTADAPRCCYATGRFSPRIATIVSPSNMNGSVQQL